MPELRQGKSKFFSKEEEGEIWLISYIDFLTLLLCFFLLLYASATIKKGEVEEYMQKLQKAFGFKVEMASDRLKALQMEEKILNEIQKKLNDFIKEKKKENALNITRNPHGITIDLKESILFGPGEASLKKESIPVLNFILYTFKSTIKGIPFQVVIEGHTDNIPIHNERFPSNWELSGARAGSVARYFIENSDVIKGNQISISGYAENKPVASNNTPEGRAKNRRVVIKIVSLISDKYSKKEE